MRITPFIIFICLLVIQACRHDRGEIRLAGNGKTPFSIVLNSPHSESQIFAADELAKYLGQITGTTFKINTDNKNSMGPVISLVPDSSLIGDSYSIISGSRNITLAGNSDRSFLYAVYDLLEMCGCHWLAPDFHFYGGRAEIIPRDSSLSFPANKSVRRHPVFTYRKLDVAEGKTTDTASLNKMIDWMAKNRLNTLMVPMNMHHKGRTMWDNFRSLIPEIQKRGIVSRSRTAWLPEFFKCRHERRQNFQGSSRLVRER